MPEAVTVYRCALCRALYETEVEARNCEARGPAPTWPKGLIFQIPDHQFKRVVFALAWSHISAHESRPKVWVTRDDGGDDTLSYMAGLPTTYATQTSNPTICSPDRALAAFGRMLVHLEQRGVQPQLWTAAGPIPYEPDPYETDADRHPLGFRTPPPKDAP